MLEGLAIQYTNQTEQDLRLIGYGLSILGAIISATLSRNTSVLRRAPYFAYSGALFLASASIQLIWLGSLSALTGGYLWLFFLTDVMSSVVVGYFYGIVAMARSRDAFGTRRYAALAFIPLANLWLLLKPSKNESAADPTIPILTGGFGVATGFVFYLGAVGLSSYLATEVDRIAESATHNTHAQQVSIDYLLRANGLEATLEQLAVGVPPQKIDQSTSLKHVESHGATLQYVYEVSDDIAVLPNSLSKDLTHKNCSNQAIRPLIEAGATLEHIYLRRSGDVVGTVVVTPEKCGLK